MSSRGTPTRVETLAGVILILVLALWVMVQMIGYARWVDRQADLKLSGVDIGTALVCDRNGCTEGR